MGRSIYRQEIKDFATSLYVTSDLSKEKVLNRLRDQFGEEVELLHLSTIDQWATKYNWVANRKKYQEKLDSTGETFNAIVEGSGSVSDRNSLISWRESAEGVNRLAKKLEEAIYDADTSFKGNPERAAALYLDINKFRMNIYKEAVNQTILSAVLYNGIRAIDECLMNTADQNDVKRKWKELNEANGINLLPKLESWLGIDY